MAADSVVETRGLVRRFAATTVLAGLDLRVGAAEIVAVFGANGAGKTTLLRILATLLSPTAGLVRLFDTDAFGPAGARLRRRLGVLTHESFLYPDLTAIENLQYYARLYGVEDPAVRIPEVLAWADLGNHGARTVRSYSKGMTQRLALARALLHRPELLLLDEPFSGLDGAGAEAVDEMLRRARAAGGAALLTTHDVDRGLRLADRVYILHRGRVAWESPTTPTAAVFAEAYRRAIESA